MYPDEVPDFRANTPGDDCDDQLGMLFVLPAR